MMQLETRKLGEYWWITGDDEGPFGPYNTKREADEDRRGLTRSERFALDHDYWTSDRKK